MQSFSSKLEGYMLAAIPGTISKGFFNVFVVVLFIFLYLLL